MRFDDRFGLARLDLLGDQAHHRRLEFVFVLLGIPLAGHVFDQHLGHLQLAGAGCHAPGAGLGQVQFVLRLDVVAPPHQVQHQRIPRRNQRRQMLLGLDDDLGDADLAGLRQGVPQQGVHLLALVDGRHVVRPFKIDERNLGRVHELLYFNGLRGARIGVGDLFRGNDDVLAVFILHALDDVVLIDFLAGALIDALVPDRVHGALVQPVEVHPGLRGRGMQADGNMDEAKRDGPFPDGSCCHDQLL
ncbi:hypothetical protein D3C71_1393480 [compost metagenome]